MRNPHAAKTFRCVKMFLLLFFFGEHTHTLRRCKKSLFFSLLRFANALEEEDFSRARICVRVYLCAKEKEEYRRVLFMCGACRRCVDYY
jgi:hypothetical protein